MAWLKSPATVWLRPNLILTCWNVVLGWLSVPIWMNESWQHCQRNGSWGKACRKSGKRSCPMGCKKREGRCLDWGFCSPSQKIHLPHERECHLEHGLDDDHGKSLFNNGWRSETIWLLSWIASALPLSGSQDTFSTLGTPERVRYTNTGK